MNMMQNSKLLKRKSEINMTLSVFTKCPVTFGVSPVIIFHPAVAFSHE